MATCPQCGGWFTDDQQVCPRDRAPLLPDTDPTARPVGETVAVRRSRPESHSTLLAADREIASADEIDLLPGETVGEYRVLGKLGEGGCGAVFEAVHPLIGKQVAIKVIKRRYSLDPLMVERFVAEARAVNQIRHRNIIDIFSFGRLPDGRHFYVMEKLAGTSLDAILGERGRLPLAEALRILRPIGRALDAAHASGIAHRDIKPENVFVSYDEDGSPTPKLLDFGLAKLVSADVERQHRTHSGTVVGTPSFMSPEQCRATAIDHRTDIYSFGVMAFRTLTGQLPFRAENFMQVMLKHCSEAPPTPSTLCPELPVSIDRALLWMLEKDPDARPQTLADALKALEEAGGPDTLRDSRPGGSRPAGDPVESAPAPAPVATSLPAGRAPLPLPPPRRRPTALIAGGALALAVAATLAIALADPTPASTPPATEALVERYPTATEKPTSPSTPPATEAQAVSSPTAPPSVSLVVKGPPKGTAVLGPDGAALGEVPGTIELPRGATPLKLTFRAPGYVDHTREVLPSEDGTVEIALARKPATRPRIEGDALPGNPYGSGGP